MDQPPRILVVDDEEDQREILEFNLSSEGFDVDTISSAEEALELPLENYSLILLDVMMSGMSGYRLADIIRKKKQLKTPIIFLTAKVTENDLLTGFNVGGDDYISKPYSIKEVVVRIRAILKRGEGQSGKPGKLKYKGLKLELDKKKVYIDKKELKLTKKEFEILVLLMKNMGSYLSRNEIMGTVWNDGVVVTDRNVDVNITRLRKKIGIYGSCILGRTGFGYCFQDE